jgi:AcrR family transcriptional regulator
MDVALELFLKRGYKGTSMDAVAAAAGVTKPVIYDCFAGKAELFEAVLDREEQKMFDRFGEALLSGALRGDVQDAFTAGFTSMLRAVLDAPKAYRVVMSSGGDAAALLGARVRSGRERQVAAIAELARQWLGGAAPSGQVGALAEDRMGALAEDRVVAPTEDRVEVLAEDRVDAPTEDRVEAPTEDRVDALAEDRVEALAQLVGETLVSIGEAGVRMVLSEPERWPPEVLGPLLGRLAAGGYAAVLRSEPGRAALRRRRGRRS